MYNKKGENACKVYLRRFSPPAWKVKVLILNRLFLAGKEEESTTQKHEKKNQKHHHQTNGFKFNAKKEDITTHWARHRTQRSTELTAFGALLVSNRDAFEPPFFELEPNRTFKCQARFHGITDSIPQNPNFQGSNFEPNFFKKSRTY